MEMESIQPSVAAVPRRQQLRWRVIGQYLPVIAFGLAAFLIIRNLTEGDAPASSSVSIDPQHAERLAADIAFFEGRVVETKDNLSYNRLTSLYLQRFRETGDVSDIKRADLSAQRSLEGAPDDYPGLMNLALVKNVEHDFPEAVALANQAIAIVPTRADAKAVRGDAMLGLGRYDEASSDYKAFLDQLPDSSAFSREASIAEVNGNIPLAEQFWQAAIDADKSGSPETSAWARVQLGTLYFNVGRLDKASNQFDTAIKVFPGYHAALAGQGKILAAHKDYQGAIQKYTEATAHVPVPDYVAALVDLNNQVGNGAQANRSDGLMTAIDQIYQSNGIVAELSVIIYGTDHGADPAAMLARARAAYAERPGVQAADTLAWALYRAGKLDEAAEFSRLALRLNTKDPLFHFHAGVIANARGDSAAARDHLQQVHDLNPRFSVLHAAEAETALKALTAAR